MRITIFADIGADSNILLSAIISAFNKSEVDISIEYLPTYIIFYISASLPNGK